MQIGKLNNQYINTLLAALAFYRENGMGEPANRSDAIHGIATGEDLGYEDISLDEAGIKELEERITKARTTDVCNVIVLECANRGRGQLSSVRATDPQGLLVIQVIPDVQPMAEAPLDRHNLVQIPIGQFDYSNDVDDAVLAWATSHQLEVPK